MPASCFIASAIRHSLLNSPISLADFFKIYDVILPLDNRVTFLVSVSDLENCSLYKDINFLLSSELLKDDKQFHKCLPWILE